MSATLSAVAYTCAILVSDAGAQSAQRPPSVPLVTTDPYFSIWSNTETLTAKPTTHWTGKPHRLTSLIRIDGQAYRLMGPGNDDAAPAMKQTSVTVYPTRSVYVFEEHGVKVTLTFTTPLLPDDLKVLSRPVSYITWAVQSTDGKAHEAAVYFDARSEISVNELDQNVITARSTAGTLTTLSASSEEQNVLLNSGDDRRIDWGHFYVAADSKDAKLAIAPAADARKQFAADGTAPGSDTASTPVAAKDAPVLAVAMSLGNVSDAPVSRHVTLAYDDEVSIKYFREELKPYWRAELKDAAALITAAEKDYESLMKRCEAFDNELVADLKKIGGESYAQIGVLAWRQALAAQKVTVDAKGQPLSFSKENNSNGCIATVDVLYPASPQMLVFAPSLLKASLVPLLDYSASPLWKHDSAPHDIGQYPLATGQVYGGETTSPMPVEESGNMLIMIAALAKVEGNAEFAEKYWPVLTTWANYLKEHGLDPANQLTTDDFAGHIARNSNLSAKAIMGIASYGLLADMLGKDAVAKQSMATAREYAKKWMEMADEGDHYKLVFGDAGNGTWSQKYNLVWDKLLDLNVFPPEVAQKELAYYRTKMNKYGVPLDSRKSYTKLDWQYWTATMAESESDFRMISDAVALWASETPARVPLSDWYETDTGKQSGFQARSVVGGVYIGLMRDKSIWQKYAKRDKLKPDNWAELPWKMPPAKKILATAQSAPANWKYTTSAPGDQWMTATFDDTQWKTGRSGFGTKGTPNAIVNTQWNTDEIYLRREFDLPEGKLNDPQLIMHYDENVEVYINGVLATKSNGFVTDYSRRPLSKAAREALRPGKNIVAVRCRQKTGGQYIDLGIDDVLPMPK